GLGVRRGTRREDGPMNPLPDAAAYKARGNERLDKGDLDGALADYTEAIARDPALAAAYFNRALVLQQQGDLDAALADLDRVLELSPADAEAYCVRGEVRRQRQ